VKLPVGKIPIPGVVSHATDLVEHPELTADRIIRFAEVVGQENVITGIDRGLGGRLHPQIGRARLRARFITLLLQLESSRGRSPRHVLHYFQGRDRDVAANLLNFYQLGGRVPVALRLAGDFCAGGLL
jgi:hypothetical protein